MEKERVVEDVYQLTESYEPPSLTKVGNFAELTLGPCCGEADSFGHFFF
ncbi:lasso RiPP family leader peptide-containing protein [Streptomyces sp. NPDC017988]